jgi:hypothetical protein
MSAAAYSRSHCPSAPPTHACTTRYPACKKLRQHTCCKSAACCHSTGSRSKLKPCSPGLHCMVTPHGPTPSARPSAATDPKHVCSSSTRHSGAQVSKHTTKQRKGLDASSGVYVSSLWPAAMASQQAHYCCEPQHNAFSPCVHCRQHLAQYQPATLLFEVHRSSTSAQLPTQ